MCGILDTVKGWFETGSEYVDVSVTEKATTTAQDKVIEFAERYGLDKLFPTRTETVTQKAAAPAITGIDPKILLLVGGIALVGILMFLKKKRR